MWTPEDELQKFVNNWMKFLSHIYPLHNLLHNFCFPRFLAMNMKLSDSSIIYMPPRITSLKTTTTTTKNKNTIRRKILGIFHNSPTVYFSDFSNMFFPYSGQELLLQSVVEAELVISYILPRIEPIPFIFRKGG